MTTAAKELWKALKAQLDAASPSWRKDFNTFEAAAVALAPKIHEGMKEGEAEVKVRDALAKYRRTLRDEAHNPPPPPMPSCLQERDEDEKEQDTAQSVFDNTPGGRYNAAERPDQIGRELPSSEEDEESGGGRRGAAPGRSEDSLWRPEAMEHSDTPYKWNPRAPRDGGAIKC